MLIEPKHSKISIVRQCELLGISRSGYYYKPAGESDYNLLLMRLIDEEYTRHPFYGVPRMTEYLMKQGHSVNHKRVERLMREMGLEGICPKKNLSRGKEGHRIYPYLLRGLEVSYPNQVWCSDITLTMSTSNYFKYFRWLSIIFSSDFFESSFYL